MSNDSNNIVHFQQRTRKPSQAVATQAHIWATVRSIESWAHFYWENVSPILDHVWDFIKILLESGHITIFTQGTEITRYTKFSVLGTNGFSSELDAWNFIKLICRNSRKVEDIGEYILSWLTSRNIKVWFHQDDSFHEERTLTSGDLEGYQVENILSRVETDTYNVDLHFGNELTMWYAHVDDFDAQKEATLLDMILCAFDDAETFNKVSIHGVYIDITCEQSEDSTTTHIPPKFVEKVIHSALVRIDSSLYSSMNFEEAWKHYFQYHVIPKLSGVKMN